MKISLKNEGKKFLSQIRAQNFEALQAGIYLLKVHNKSTRIWCEICSKLTIKTPERRQWRHAGVFIVNSEHISYFVLVFLLTLKM